MKSGDPEIWLHELDDVCSKLQLSHQYIIDDDMYIIHIMGNMIPDYEELITNFEKGFETCTLTIVQMNSCIVSKPLRAYGILTIFRIPQGLFGWPLVSHIFIFF